MQRDVVECDFRDPTFENSAGIRKYNSQFNNIYKSRTQELKSRVFKMAQAKWNTTEINGKSPKYINKILDVPPVTPAFIIGTVFAEMKYKPDVLKEVELAVQGHSDISKVDETKLNKIEQLRAKSYSDPKSDELWLEDESGRILIDGELLDKAIMVTGILVAVLGMEVESGVFHAVDIMYPEAAPQQEINHELQKDGSLLLCSGLNINESADRSKYELLKNWVMGDLGDRRAESVSQILISGNVIKASQNKQKTDTTKNKYNEQFNSPYDRDSMLYADELLESLCRSVPVAIMPGVNDVVEMGLPKQPIHHSLFHKTAARSNFNRLTDPTWLNVNGLRILATSGQNIEDVFKYIIPNLKVDTEIDDSVAYDSRLRLIEDSLLWQIIAPTAPDTLWCYPYEDHDPFTLKETPHVYIIGNQPRFETSLVDLKRKNGDTVTVRIIAIPEYSAKSECVILDLKTLECSLIKFTI